MDKRGRKSPKYSSKNHLNTHPHIPAMVNTSKFWVEIFQIAFQLIEALLRKVILLNEPYNLEIVKLILYGNPNALSE